MYQVVTRQAAPSFHGSSLRADVEDAFHGSTYFTAPFQLTKPLMLHYASRGEAVFVGIRCVFTAYSLRVLLFSLQDVRRVSALHPYVRVGCASFYSNWCTNVTVVATLSACCDSCELSHRVRSCFVFSFILRLTSTRVCAYQREVEDAVYIVNVWNIILPTGRRRLHRHFFLEVCVSHLRHASVVFSSQHGRRVEVF